MNQAYRKTETGWEPVEPAQPIKAEAEAEAEAKAEPEKPKKERKKKGHSEKINP